MNKKSNRRIAFLCVVLHLLAGCAEMTTKTYRPRREVTVKYSKGWFMTDKNREKAVEIAKDFCSPSNAVLLAEDSKKEFTGHSSMYSSTSNNTTTGNIQQDQESNVYLHFACSRPSARR